MTFGGVVIASEPAPTLNPTSTPSAAAPNQAWTEAAGQKETAAPLRRFPAGLSFAGLPEPIFYDAARQQLLYRGLMSNGSYLYLRRLSTDAEYHAALEQLYLGSAAAKSGRGYGVLYGGIAGAVLALLALGGWLLLH